MLIPPCGRSISPKARPRFRKQPQDTTERVSAQDQESSALPSPVVLAQPDRDPGYCVSAGRRPRNPSLTRRLQNRLAVRR